MLVILGFLIVLIGLLQRLDALSSKGDSFSQLALQADMTAKFSYAQEGLSRLSGKRPARATVFSAAGLKEQDAVKMYRRVLRDSPVPRHIRRYIILQHDTDTPGIEKSIGLLEESAARPEYGKSRQKRLLAEVDMWRAIYLNPGVPRADVQEFRDRIRRLGLGWYSHLSLRDLYRRAGLDEQAGREQTAASRSAMVNAALLMAVLAAALLVVISGMALLVAYASWKTDTRSRLPAGQVPELPADPGVVSGYLLEVFVVYLAALLGAEGVGGVLLGVLMLATGDLSATTAAVITTASYVIGGLGAFVYLSYRLRLAGWSWSGIGLRTENLGRNVLWGVAGYSAAFPLVLAAAFLSDVVGRYIRTPENPVVPLFAQADTVFAKLALFVLLAIAAPFFEEVFFRGVLLTACRARWGVIAGVIISSAVFASVHPLPVQFLPIFVLGTAFALLMYERRSLVPAITAHALQNAGVFLLLMVLTGQ